jgi:DNA-binding NarL/FixJ family response regulator
MKRILVVEDSADLLEFLEDSLSREYRVDLAANGLEALNIMKTGRIPDLIISDVMMPVMDGPTLLKQLKQSERLASIPLIFLTARNQPNERVQSIVDGAVAYIAKPFFFEELQAAIDNILKLKDSGIKEVERRLMSALHAKPDEASFHGGEGFEAKADKFGFSKQEREVASLLITGKSDKEIAAALSLSPRTVSNYMGKMLKKAQVSGRTELATRLTE